VVDLNDNDMIVRGTQTRDDIDAMIAHGRNGGAWNAAGITSTAAKAAPHNTTLGNMTGAEYHGIYGAGATFNGRVVANTDKLIKYTLYGDTDFNGVVDFDDYVRTDGGFNGGKTGWINGDFDQSGAVDFDDYVLLDLGFNTQSQTLSRVTEILAGPDPLRKINSILKGANLHGASTLSPSEMATLQHAEMYGDQYINHFLNGVPEPSTIG